MKQKVLIFASNPDLDKKIIEELEKTGIECKTASDLGTFHWVLSVNFIDALIFDAQFFIDKCASPLQLLERFKSNHVIIEYFPKAQNKKDKIKTYLLDSSKIPKNKLANPDRDVTLITQAVMRAIPSLNYNTQKIQYHINEEILEVEPTYDLLGIVFQKNILTFFQHKQLQILSFIACTAEIGCTNVEIATEIWGKTGKTRKKDIQSYISKINVKLGTLDAENHIIVHLNKRYFLQKK